MNCAVIVVAFSKCSVTDELNVQQYFHNYAKIFLKNLVNTYLNSQVINSGLWFDRKGKYKNI